MTQKQLLDIIKNRAERAKKNGYYYLEEAGKAPTLNDKNLCERQAAINFAIGREYESMADMIRKEVII